MDLDKPIEITIEVATDDEYKIVLDCDKTYYRFNQYNNDGQPSSVCFIGEIIPDSATGKKQLYWKALPDKAPAQFLEELLEKFTNAKVVYATKVEIKRAEYVWIPDAPIGGSWARLDKEIYINEV